MKIPLARLENGRVVATRGGRTLSSASRTAMLSFWDLMDADQQDQLLLAAEAILARNDEPVVVPAFRNVAP